jgi:hypothetical protein
MQTLTFTYVLPDRDHLVLSVETKMATMLSCACGEWIHQRTRWSAGSAVGGGSNFHH